MWSVGLYITTISHARKRDRENIVAIEKRALIDKDFLFTFENVEF